MQCIMSTLGCLAQRSEPHSESRGADMAASKQGPLRCAAALGGLHGFHRGPGGWTLKWQSRSAYRGLRLVSAKPHTAPRTHEGSGEVCQRTASPEKQKAAPSVSGPPTGFPPLSAGRRLYADQFQTSERSTGERGGEGHTRSSTLHGEARRAVRGAERRLHLLIADAAKISKDTRALRWELSPQDAKLWDFRLHGQVRRMSTKSAKSRQGAGREGQGILERKRDSELHEQSRSEAAPENKHVKPNAMTISRNATNKIPVMSKCCRA